MKFIQHQKLLDDIDNYFLGCFANAEEYKSYQAELTLTFPKAKEELLHAIAKSYSLALDLQAKYALDSSNSDIYGQLEEVKKHLQRAERLLAKVEF